MTTIAVIGTSCSGKSTLSAKISAKLSIPHIELDEFHWLPNWVERPDSEFLGLVRAATEDDSWVVDGNYSVARDIIWPRTETIVWLDYPFAVVLWRAISRSFRRVFTQEKLFSGNVESARQAFFSKDSIILWVIQTHSEKRKKYTLLIESEAVKGKAVVRLKSQRDTDAYLESLN